MASSAGNPTVWSPYGTYKDCSQGICSIYCPQWCYIIFPPPPPFDTGDDSNDSAPNFSPLIIAVIGILGSAFLLVSYYTIISKYCKKVDSSDGDQNTSNAVELHLSQINDGQLQPNQQPVGLDESIIKSLAVYKFKKNDRVIDGVDCAVCLSEFQENESLRLLPKCRHAFHLHCIDTWLRSHPNCPLCRASVVHFANPLPLQGNSSTTFNVSSLQTTIQNDLVLVIENREVVHQNHVVDIVGNSSDQGNEVNGGNIQGIGRSLSMQSHLHQSHILISDILNVSEDQENLAVENCESQLGNNSVSKQGGL